MKYKCQAQDPSSYWFLKILLLTRVKESVVVANHDVAPTSLYLSPLSYTIAETSSSTYTLNEATVHIGLGIGAELHKCQGDTTYAETFKSYKLGTFTGNLGQIRYPVIPYV